MNIVILGSTGLVGKHVLEFAKLDARINKIYLITRNPILNQIDSRIINLIHENLFIDQDFLNTNQVEKIDAVLCTLGTTIKKAGTKEKFNKIDKDLVLHLAKVFKAFGANHFSVVSALGANPYSSIFYNKVKGEMEEDLKKIDYDVLTILRPSLLIGERNEFRPSEKIMIFLAPLLNQVLIGDMKKYQAIDANLVALALFNSIFNSGNGIKIIENDQLLKK